MANFSTLEQNNHVSQNREYWLYPSKLQSLHPVMDTFAVADCEISLDESNDPLRPHNASMAGD